MPIDQEILKVYNKNICKKCKYEKVKFITKTTCRDVYLLCDSEINEFKCLSRPNPHKGTWKDMSLYFEDEIKEYAVKKHGSMQVIETIKQERAEKLIERKKKSMKKKMLELKRKTIVKHDKNQKHVHKFVKVGNTKRCECGLEYEEEEI